MNPRTLSLPPSGPLAWVSSLTKPEDYPDWWAFSGYSDLLEFERDACNIARSTILFAESEGSLVELGALAIDPHLGKRLFVVVQANHMQPAAQKSFIYLGPIRRLESLGRVCVIGTSAKLTGDDIGLLTEYFTDSFKNPHKSEAFDPKSPTHVLLLLADLVDLLLVANSDEIMGAMAHFGVNISESNLTKYATLLRFFELISVEKRGGEVFYVQTKHSDAPWVDYSAVQKTGSERFHRSRFKIDCEAWIKAASLRKSVWEQRA